MTLFFYILLGLFGLFFLFLILLQWMVSEAMNNRFGKSAGHRATIVHRIFFWVVRELIALANYLNLSYNEVNILVFYVVIPFMWCTLLDMYWEIHYLKIGYALLCLAMFLIYRNFKTLSDTIYKKSVYFLLYFDRFGSNYILSSVLICLGVPLIVFGVLVKLVF